jgi:acetyl/propionyl-CoA carboxylase alpha subunit
MEARLYAEDPANGFLPSIGKLEHFVLPDDIRVDTGVFEGGQVSQFYDPMIAKLIVHETSREAAAARLADACGEVEVWPVKTNAAFLMRCLEHPRFVAGRVDTGFIGQEEMALTPTEMSEAALEDAARYLRFQCSQFVESDPYSPWHGYDGTLGFRANGSAAATQKVVVNGSARVVAISPDKHAVSHYLPLTTNSGVSFQAGQAFEICAFAKAGSATSASDGSLRAPMPGKIVATPAKAGDVVSKGQPIVVLEAMKMEHALTAPFDGVVGELGVAVGDQVSADTVLAVVKAAA